MFLTNEKESQLKMQLQDFCQEIEICLDSGLSFSESLANFFVKKCEFEHAYLTFEYALEKNPKSSYAQQCFQDLTEMRQKITQSPLFGKKYVITGDLYNMNRETALNLITLFGGETSDNPVNSMDVLVVGYCEWSELNNGRPTRKILKAQELISKGKNVRIVDDKTFIQELSSTAKSILSDESYSYFFSNTVN